ncbi:MAG: type II toxin-antitoxin system prevent-host-death family antitoxin [Chitinispirillaceae bacterium]|nr:type II toxin-antitoxin system prevent-host-death family antitoxin [Chitinispirillaceae bacterium]
MVSVSIHEAKTHLSSLISEVERKGEKIIICRHGRAIAEMVPLSKKSRLVLDNELRQVRISGDATSRSRGSGKVFEHYYSSSTPSR